MKTLGSHCYVPSLRWRRAEQLALRDLSDATKSAVVPLFTIPAIVRDFRTQRPKKSLDEHVAPFPRAYGKKWGQRPAWLALDESIETARLEDGRHVFEYLLDGVRDEGASQVVPCLTLHADEECRRAVGRAIEVDGRGVGVIVQAQDLSAGTDRQRLEGFARALGVSSDETDILVDLISINYTLAYERLVSVLAPMLARLEGDEFRNLVFVSTAIPKSLAALPLGFSAVERHDWRLFREMALGSVLAESRLVFGDHTIVHPGLHAVDPRVMRPVAKVVYTTPTTWTINKGSSFFDNRPQMYDLCQGVIEDPRFQFRDPNFSWGDRFIRDCAAKVQSYSSLETWKRVHINHHITTVVDDLAKLTGGASSP